MSVIHRKLISVFSMRKESGIFLFIIDNAISPALFIEKTNDPLWKCSAILAISRHSPSVDMFLESLSYSIGLSLFQHYTFLIAIALEPVLLSGGGCTSVLLLFFNTVLAILCHSVYFLKNQIENLERSLSFILTTD